MECQRASVATPHGPHTFKITLNYILWEQQIVSLNIKHAIRDRDTHPLVFTWSAEVFALEDN